MTEQLAKPVPRCAYEDDLLGISRCTRIEDLYDTDFGWLCNEHYRMTIRMVAYESRVRELEQALEGYEQHECGDTPDYGDRLAAAQARVRELEQERDRLPANWFEDSSLETWFPLTAEEFERTKQQLCEARRELDWMKNADIWPHSTIRKLRQQLATSKAAEGE